MDIKHSTFKGGIHPPYRKELTKDKPLITVAAPEVVVIPMSLHIGAPCKPVVKKGDKVKKGQLIGEANGFVSVPIHASVSGEVKAVEPRLHPNGQKVMSVVIENDMEESLHEDIISRGELENLSPQEIKDIILNAGIVGLGGATFPTHVKLSPPPDKNIDCVIINAAECEPYLTTDDHLMRDFPEKIVYGLKAMMKVLGVDKGFIGIEDNKPEAIEAMFKAVDEKDNIEIYSLHTKYPQGSEKQLIAAVTGREVPSGALPMDAGVVVSNVGTALAVSDAIRLGMPLIERVVTVTGSAITDPQTMIVKIGTSVNHLIEACGGFSEPPAKVINGGPMMGIAQFSTDIPVIKATSGILCLNEKDAYVPEPSQCIRCGKCVSVCPVKLLPLYISEYSLRRDFDKCKSYNALDCVECGSCSFICPAKRTLVSSIRVAKREIIASSRKGN
ncbi:electron transport complex subunit RsxC [Alkalibacter mobilis]|uniref:electron transport complex subunit RsxC n=1 Tax=Alkalibacter mobilis TaxID=2787712 RepID=UPI00189DB93E|nr:electron transport complex subunit RsxC [Alkalibacter mobilis]MBF7097854.1 electron transport complex subunit RsxC [Alkalibacter mobilis]